MLSEKPFANADRIDEQKELLEAALGLLLSVSSRQARDQLNSIYTASKKNTEKLRSGVLCGLSGFFALATFLAFAEMFFARENGAVQAHLSELSKLQMRTQFTLAFSAICFGFAMLASEKVRLNYNHLLEVPYSEQMVVPSKPLIYGFTYWGIISCFGIVACAAVEDTGPVPLPFGQYINYFARKLPPNYWVMLTTIVYVAALFYTMRAIFDGRAPTIRYFLITVFKTLTPWAHTVTMAPFLTGCILMSMTRFIRDVVTVVSCRRAPLWLAHLISAYPSAIRMVQSWKKFLVKKEVYPYIVYMLIISITVFTQYQSYGPYLRGRTWQFWTLTACKVVETLGLIYWDLCEDAGLFTGGFGARIFRQKPQKWQYGRFLCRRPSFLPLWAIWLFVALDVAARFLWLLTSLMTGEDPVYSSFACSSLVALIEIARRYVWVVFRLDNQQATNCNDFVATKYIPILIDEQGSKQIQRQIVPDLKPERISLDLAQNIDQIRQSLEFRRSFSDRQEQLSFIHKNSIRQSCEVARLVRGTSFSAKNAVPPTYAEQEGDSAGQIAVERAYVISEDCKE